MTRLWAIIGYVVGVFVGAAVLAPWVWWAAKGAAAAWPQGWLEWLARHPFPRYVHRCLLVLALAGLWPLTRALGYRTWESVGWRAGAGWGRRMAAGFGAGLVGFAILVALEWGSGVRGWKEGVAWSGVVAGAGRAILSAAVVAMVEETLFRGVLWGGLRPVAGSAGAVGVSAFVYAAVHFFARPSVPDQVTWFSGFETLMSMMRGFAAWERLMPAFATLYLLGVLFGLSRSHEGSVYFAVGLHASLVFWVKMRGVLTVNSAGNSQGGELLSGWLALALTVLVVLIYSLAACRGSRELHRSKPTQPRD